MPAPRPAAATGTRDADRSADHEAPAELPAAPRTATGAPPRRQEDRRAATRRALLDATAASLVEHGCAGTTTTVVVARAGVSQGALFKHFPTKADLLVATGAHLYDQLTEQYLRRARRLTRHRALDERLAAGVRLLWDLFASETYAAALDLNAAARTDHELRAGLEHVVTEHGERIRNEAAALFPEAAHHPDFAITIDLVLEAMVGMASSRLVDHQPAHYRRLVQHLVDLTVDRVGDGGRSDPRTDPRTDPRAPRGGTR